jgi:hypothetical protein
MTEPRYDPDERFSLDETAEDVLRKLLGVEPAEESEDETEEATEP